MTTTERLALCAATRSTVAIGAAQLERLAELLDTPDQRTDCRNAWAKLTFYAEWLERLEERLSQPDAEAALRRRVQAENERYWAQQQETQAP